MRFALVLSVCSNVLVWTSVTIVGAAVSPQTKGMHLIWITPSYISTPVRHSRPRGYYKEKDSPTSHCCMLNSYENQSNKIIWEGNNFHSGLGWGMCTKQQALC